MSNLSQSSAGKIEALRPLSQAFYEQATPTVARNLLGKYLIRETSKGRLIGLINETEAYPGISDQASHSYKGPTKRTAVLFGQAGTIYVYLIYGLYHCLNVVTDMPETGGAVLIRSLIPIEGIKAKTSGPGLVCKALAIDRTWNGKSIIESSLTIQEATQVPPPRIVALPRIGIRNAKDQLLRFRIASA